MSKPIFISHAVANKELADKIVDLLEGGIGIPDNEIFCSSLEGLGVPSGTNFIEFIRKQISQPSVVILLLTEDYFNSQFCLSELGASWVLSHKIIPLLVPPLAYRDVKAVLTGIQVLKIMEPTDLNQMQEELTNSLSIKGKSFARWEVKRNKFLINIEEILAKQSKRKTISLEEYNELKTKYEEAINEISILEEEVSEKESVISKLKIAKNTDQVKNILFESLEEPEAFEELVYKSKEIIDKLPTIVKEALYYQLRNECLPWPDAFDNYKRNEVDEAIEKDYLVPYDEGCSLVEDDPNVEKALLALIELKGFVNSIDEVSDFRDYYAENYDHRLNFSSRRFWETHLW